MHPDSELSHMQSQQAIECSTLYYTIQAKIGPSRQPEAPQLWRHINCNSLPLIGKGLFCASVRETDRVGMLGETCYVYSLLVY